MIWKPVVGFECLYEVSDAGLVRRIGRTRGAKHGRILKDQFNRGYRSVQLWRDDKPKTCLVHVLVAETFDGPKLIGHEVNHDDGQKSHNHEFTPQNSLMKGNARKCRICVNNQERARRRRNKEMDNDRIVQRMGNS